MIEDLDKWRKSGKIAVECLNYGKSLIVKGAKLLDVTEKIEAKIIELGGKPAFPVQISCDSIAAHYCAYSDDNIVFDDQVVCLDVGVHVDGCVGGDNALTVDLSGKYSDLVRASMEALNAAQKALEEQRTLGEMGKAIQEAIQSFGLSPVKNLSGHGLGKFNIHTKPSIPNYDNGDKTIIKDMVMAIEPFATNGKGVIYESGQANIFSLKQKKPVRNNITRKVLKEIETYNGLPFCSRWLHKKFSPGFVNFALREMKNMDMINEFPPLPDQGKGMVSQAENSFYVDEEGGVEVLTKID